MVILLIYSFGDTGLKKRMISSISFEKNIGTLVDEFNDSGCMIIVDLDSVSKSTLESVKNFDSSIISYIVTKRNLGLDSLGVIPIGDKKIKEKNIIIVGYSDYKDDTKNILRLGGTVLENSGTFINIEGKELTIKSIDGFPSLIEVLEDIGADIW